MKLCARNFLSMLSAVAVMALTLFAGCAGAGIHSKPSTTPSDPTSSNLKKGVETFDAAWRIIYESHFDTNFNGVNWTAVRDELRPKAEAAKTVVELREVIEQMLHRLGESHMGLIPGAVADAVDPAKIKQSSAPSKRPSAPVSKSANRSPAEIEDNDESEPTAGQEGEVGFDVRLIDDKMVVSQVDPNSAANANGVKTGWIVESVRNVRLSERLEKLLTEVESQKAHFLAWRMVKAMLMGNAGSSVPIDFLNETNQPVTLMLERRPAKGSLAKLGLLPPLYAHLESKRIKSSSGADIGLIRFNLFMIPIAGAFDQSIDQFRDADGIVIDLRGNFGGIAGMIMGFAGHFLKERVTLGTMKMRENEIKFFANPRFVNPAGKRVEPYDGPLAILVDSVSLSAAEIFAGGMQDVGRARVFGENSPGQALPAVWDRLPNGDALYHAFADFVTASGVRLEGRGVVPDENLPLKREDLLAGRDQALLAAMKWISGQHRKKSANAQHAAQPNAQPIGRPGN